MAREREKLARQAMATWRNGAGGAKGRIARLPVAWPSSAEFIELDPQRPHEKCLRLVVPGVNSHTNQP